MSWTAEAPVSAGEFDPITRHNVRVESLFSAFNGIYMALALFAAPVVAVTGVDANPLELTILVSAFPMGVFFGPLWAELGRRWGMKKLVTNMAIFANLPLFFIYWVEDAAVFTALITVSQLLNSAMRMGQSSLYRVMYAKSVRGRVLGKLAFWTYLTMVPTILVSGWLLDKSHAMYQVLYPLAGLCGLVGCFYYKMLHVPEADRLPRQKSTLMARVRGVEQLIAGDRAYFLFQFAFFLSGSAFFMSTHVILLLVSDRTRFHFGAFELVLWLSVVPQLLLALTSPFWGHVLDRIGIVRVRLLISLIMTGYLASYFGGVLLGVPVLLYVGSVLQGVSNGGGQLTWSLASSHFAPRPEDVAVYNGVHFVLNGVRGLVMPWVGSVLLILLEPWAVLVATVVSAGSIPIILRSLSLGDGPDQVDAQEPEASTNGAAANGSAGNGLPVPPQPEHS